MCYKLDFVIKFLYMLNLAIFKGLNNKILLQIQTPKYIIGVLVVTIMIVNVSEIPEDRNVGEVAPFCVEHAPCSRYLLQPARIEKHVSRQCATFSAFFELYQNRLSRIAIQQIYYTKFFVHMSTEPEFIIQTKIFCYYYFYGNMQFNMSCKSVNDLTALLINVGTFEIN